MIRPPTYCKSGRHPRQLQHGTTTAAKKAATRSSPSAAVTAMWSRRSWRIHATTTNAALVRRFAAWFHAALHMIW